MKRNRRAEEGADGQEQDDDEALPPKHDISVFGNKIYFYCEVSKASVKALFMRMNELELSLANESVKFGFSPVIELHIHSEGGDLLAGMAAHDVLRASKATIHTYIEGEASSAASLIALAGKRRYITANSLVLIHQLRTMFSGKHTDLKDELASSNKMMRCMIDIYVRSTRMKRGQVNRMIKREEYLTSRECVELGIVDEVIGGPG